MKKLICSLILCGMLTSLIACSGNNDNAAPETTETTVGSDSAETTAPERDKPDFEKTDLGGASFVILAYDDIYYDNYFFADDLNGEQMNDALYERDRLTEEYLGVDISSIIVPTHRDLAASVTKSATAGDNDYQLALHTASAV